MGTRTATTTWSGGLQDGSGSVTLESSGLGTFDVSWPKRTSDTADGTTSPEELIAAAHSACFSMAFSAGLASAGASNISLTVRADVPFAPDPAGGFRIPRIILTVRGSVDGMDEETFIATAQHAKAGCPVSKALAATEILLDAAFA